jgi:hypothetical protein
MSQSPLKAKLQPRPKLKLMQWLQWCGFIVFSPISRLTCVTPQVMCERYDAKAAFMKWDTVYITMTISFMAYGSTRDKAISRALGGGSNGITAMPTTGCVCTAVARDGRPHVLSVSFPATSGVPEQCFAFATSAARDSFMRALQAASVAAAVAAKAKAQAAVEAQANAAAAAAAKAKAEAQAKAAAASAAKAKAEADAKAAAEAQAHAAKFARTVQLLQRLDLQKHIPNFM